MMRKTFAALILAASLPALSFAAPDGGQHHGGGMKGDHMMGGRMFHELDLTREQQRDMHKLMAEQMRTTHDITQRYLEKLPEAERQAMQDEIQASHEKTHQSMRERLEPEQREKFEELHQKMMEKRAEREAFMQWKAEREQNNG